MNENDLQRRIEALEIRYSHQEQAVDELTRNVLRQEAQLKLQAETIERLEQALRALEHGGADAARGDEKPPHY